MSNAGTEAAYLQLFIIKFAYTMKKVPSMPYWHGPSQKTYYWCYSMICNFGVCTCTLNTFIYIGMFW